MHMRRWMLGMLACVATAAGAALAATPAPAQGGFELALVDMRGRKQVLGTLPPSVFAPRVSPDGRRVAFELREPGEVGQEGGARIWVAELDKLDQRRMLPPVGKGDNWAPVWSEDGQHVAFLVNGDRPGSLYWRRADGSGEADHLVDGRAVEGLYGDRMVFITLAGNRDYDISLLDLRSREITPLVTRPGSEQHSSRVSPDGRWLAYASSETGRQEVWLEPLPPDGRRYQITVGGGSHPLWAPDGRTLYFDLNNRMYRVEVFIGGEAPRAGTPRGMEIRGFRQGDLRRQFDLMPDGRHFLMLFPAGQP